MTPDGDRPTNGWDSINNLVNQVFGFLKSRPNGLVAILVVALLLGVASIDGIIKVIDAMKGLLP